MQVLRDSSETLQFFPTQIIHIHQLSTRKKSFQWPENMAMNKRNQINVTSFSVIKMVKLACGGMEIHFHFSPLL